MTKEPTIVTGINSTFPLQMRQLQVGNEDDGDLFILYLILASSFIGERSTTEGYQCPTPTIVDSFSTPLVSLGNGIVELLILHLYVS